VRLRSIILPTFVAVVVAATALLFSHGSGSSTRAGTGSAPLSGDVKIDISNFMYSPAVLKVKVGSTITVTNDDETEHTATSNTEGVFDTGTLNKGQSMSFKVNKIGTFSYHCSFHAFMHGTIKVVQ
jgi:plastocyanin